MQEYIKLCKERKMSNEFDFENESKESKEENNTETEEKLLELVSKYAIYENQERLKNEMKLSEISPNQPHYLLESFALIPNNIPRLLIIGETGTGKSSFCNKMSGIYYKIVGDQQDDSSSSSDDDEKDEKNIKKKEKKKVEIICEGQSELFKTDSSSNSVTQTTSWAQVCNLQ